jgi:hypothetical protein
MTTGAIMHAMIPAMITTVEPSATMAAMLIPIDDAAIPCQTRVQTVRSSGQPKQLSLGCEFPSFLTTDERAATALLISFTHYKRGQGRGIWKIEVVQTSTDTTQKMKGTSSPGNPMPFWTNSLKAASDRVVAL